MGGPEERTGSTRPGMREWAGLGVLVLPCVVLAMDTHLLNLALPRVAAELQPTGGELLWIADVHVFLGAGALITLGVVGDRFGSRRLLLGATAVFASASVVGASSSSVPVLIGARAVLGVAGAALVPATLSLVRILFTDPRRRTVAIGVWTSGFALGGVVGPLIGGLLLDRFRWGSVLLVAVPVMVAVLVLGPVLLPEVRDPAPGRLDLAGPALSLVAVLALVYGATRAAENGPDPSAGLAALAGVAAAAAVARRRRDPALDLGLLRNTAFVVALTTNALAFCVLYGTQYLLAQYLQLVLGLSALAAGAWTIPSAVGYLVGSLLGPAATRVLPRGTVIGVGLAVAAAGFALLTQVGSGPGLAVLVMGSVVFSVGLAPVYLLTTELAVAAAPPHRAGAATAITETGAKLGGALGIALFGSIAAASYRSTLAGAAPPAMPAEVWDAAGRTLGGTLAAAERLPADARAPLAAAARDAFTAAFQTAEGVGALLLLVAALAGRRSLRSGAPVPSVARATPDRRAPDGPAAAPDRLDAEAPR